MAVAVGSVIVTAGVAVWLPASSASRPTEKRIVLPSSIELGQLQPNEPHRVEYTVKNNSNSKIEITKLDASCSCLELSLEGDGVMRPGEERKVVGSVDFGLKEGSHEVIAVVAYKDGAGRPMEASTPVRGLVKAALVLGNTVLDFGAVNASEKSRSGSVSIKPGQSGEKWDSINLEYERENLTASVEKLPDGSSQVSVVFDPAKLPISQFRQPIRLHLMRGPNELRYVPSFTVIAQIKGPMKASPPTVYLGAVKPKEKLERLITISSHDLDLRTVTIEGGSPMLLAETVEASANEARIRVEINAPEASGAFDDRLLIVHKESGVAMRLPIMGVVK